MLHKRCRRKLPLNFLEPGSKKPGFRGSPSSCDGKFNLSRTPQKWGFLDGTLPRPFMTDEKSPCSKVSHQFAKLSLAFCWQVSPKPHKNEFLVLSPHYLLAPLPPPFISEQEKASVSKFLDSLRRAGPPVIRVPAIIKTVIFLEKRCCGKLAPEFPRARLPLEL